MDSKSEPLTLSIIVVPVVGPQQMETCLRALQDQRDHDSSEIIVPTDSRFGETTALEKQFPDVKFIPSERLLTFAELRARAAQAATGQIIAITEDHCLPGAGWCDAILKAHKEPHAAIGGVVNKRTPDSTLSWAFYFADYVRYSPPLAEGPSHSLTDLNVTYKRAALKQIAEVWSEEFHENLVHQALLDRGETLWLSPKIEVNQGRNIALQAAVQDRYAFGRLYASTRTSVIPGSKRLILLLTSPIIPALLVIRVIGHVRRTGKYIPEFLRSLPFVTLLSTVWAWGEFTGYLTGRPAKSLSATPQRALGNS